ncbi:MAG TPA: hypothetical protein VET27_20205 [Mycobacterium sp.]|nr:hypothetical protein [Mycobacterium sp.]
MIDRSALEDRIIRSFNRFPEQPATSSLSALRKRLVGEVFGDADDVAATLDPAFEVVINTALRVPLDA